MNLYSKKKDKLIIYSLDTTIEIISDFKREQMLTIPEEYRILCAETNDKCCLELGSEDIAYRELEKLELAIGIGGIVYHKLGPSRQLGAVKEMILEEYYKILGPNGRLKRISFNEKYIEYLLLINEKYRTSSFDYSKHVMSEIINIPRLLFVYERFIRGNLLNITDEELKKILDLYTLSKPLETINLKEVYKLDFYGLTESTESQISNKLSQSEKILSLIQK